MSTHPAVKPSLHSCVVMVLILCIAGAIVGAGVGVLTHRTLTTTAVYACAAEGLALIVGLLVCLLRRRNRPQAEAEPTTVPSTDAPPVQGSPPLVTLTSELPQTVAMDVVDLTGDFPALTQPQEPQPEQRHLVEQRKAALEQRLGLSLPVAVAVDRADPEQGWADMLHQIRCLEPPVRIVLCVSAGRGAAVGELAAGLSVQAGRQRLHSALVQVRGDEASGPYPTDPAALHQAFVSLAETSDLVIIDAPAWEDQISTSLRAHSDLVLVESPAPTPKAALIEVMTTLSSKKFLATSIPVGLAMIRGEAPTDH